MNVTVEIERRGEEPRPEWVCPSCHQPASMREVRANLSVCPHCGHHLRIGARERIRQLVDEGSFRELWANLRTLDPLAFADLETYPERVREAQAKTGLAEAIVTGTAMRRRHTCVLAVMDFSFMGGSMGSVVGEKVARRPSSRAARTCRWSWCRTRRRPHAGGDPLADADGQDERAAGVIKRRRLPFVSVLVDPCTGGVVASFATLADVVHRRARRTALTSAGPRVIQQTTREALPKGFSTAERNLVLGHLDAVVARKDLRANGQLPATVGGR